MKRPKRASTPSWPQATQDQRAVSCHEASGRAVRVTHFNVPPLNINCEVIGFVIASDGLPSVYVSGENASIERVREVAAKFPQIHIAVLFTGAARVDFKDEGRPLTLTAERAADAALLLGAETVVPAHFRGWAHFSQTPGELAAAFADAGIAERLHVPEPGVWTVRDPA